jgi:transcriptional regulator with XRE-family HTH domain
MNGDVKEVKKLSYNEFVRELAAKRKEKGFSMRNVAKKYNTSPATMVKFEKGVIEGEKSYEDMKMVKMYCDLLEVDFSYLVTI